MTPPFHWSRAFVHAALRAWQRWTLHFLRWAGELLPKPAPAHRAPALVPVRVVDDTAPGRRRRRPAAR